MQIVKERKEREREGDVDRNRGNQLPRMDCVPLWLLSSTHTFKFTHTPPLTHMQVRMSNHRGQCAHEITRQHYVVPSNYLNQQTTADRIPVVFLPCLLYNVFGNNHPNVVLLSKPAKNMLIVCQPFYCYVCCLLYLQIPIQMFCHLKLESIHGQPV